METKVNETMPEEEVIDVTSSSTEDTADIVEEAENISTTESQTPVVEVIADEETAETADGEASDEADPQTDLQSQLSAALAQAQKNKEGWQRVAADLANFKRRQEEQAGQLRFSLTSSIISDVLAAMDDLDLAFQHLPEDLEEKEANSKLTELREALVEGEKSGDAGVLNMKKIRQTAKKEAGLL